MLDKYSEARAWDQQAQQDRLAVNKIYQEATGQRASDPARAVFQQLKAGQVSAGFLNMSATLFKALADVQGVEIETLRFDKRQNLLQLSLRYPSFEAGEQLEAAVRNYGARLSVAGIRERGDTLIGEASFTLAAGDRS